MSEAEKPQKTLEKRKQAILTKLSDEDDTHTHKSAERGGYDPTREIQDEMSVSHNTVA